MSNRNGFTYTGTATVALTVHYPEKDAEELRKVYAVCIGDHTGMTPEQIENTQKVVARSAGNIATFMRGVESFEGFLQRVAEISMRRYLRESGEEARRMDGSVKFGNVSVKMAPKKVTKRCIGCDNDVSSPCAPRGECGAWE